MTLDDGGRYLPSKAQVWLWENWLDFWAKVERAKVEHKADLICLYNGDAVDGPSHHGTTQSISGSKEVQSYVATRVFGVPKQLKPIKQYMIRGTEVHVGPSGESEENLAKWLHTERDPGTEQWSSWFRRLTIHGVRIDATHHTNMGNMPWTEQTAGIRCAAAVMMEYARRGEAPPTLAFRSHVHRHADSYKAYPTRAIILPAWQLATGFGYRVNPNRLADIGGNITVIAPDGVYQTDTTVYRPDPPPYERAA